MSQSVRIADFGKLSEAEQAAALAQITAAGMAAVNGHLVAVTSQIRGLEERYEVKSEQLLVQLETGAREETAEISHWLFLLQLERRIQRAR